MQIKYKDLIPPLSAEEREGLEASIIAEGCRDALVVWEDILIDGHNRYEICTEHGVAYKVTEKTFDNDLAARVWIIKNQLARRNLSTLDRTALALKQKELFAAQAKENQLAGLKQYADTVLQKSAERIDTREEIAKIAGVSHDTVAKVEKILSKADTVTQDKVRRGQLSINGAYNEIRRDEVKQEKKQAPKIKGEYRVVYADPPWEYGFTVSHKYGDAQKHYPAMSVAELCAMPVADHISKDATLFLWATAPKLHDALHVMEAWGFEYKTNVIWNKLKHNPGYYFSMRHELLLIGGKGSSRPDRAKLYPSVIAEERTEHSVKPGRIREMIDELYTWGERIELFAREETEGWEAWGNDV